MTSKRRALVTKPCWTRHDAGFRPPEFSDLVVYQLHVGAFGGPRPGRVAKFLDVTARVPYLADLGVNAIELLPIDEFPQNVSLGYNGVDYFSPEMAYTVPPGELPGCGAGRPRHVPT